MSDKGGDPIIGYDYKFGIHMGISRGPVDELVEIRVGDRTAWPYSEREDPNKKPIEIKREYPQLIQIASIGQSDPDVTPVAGHWYVRLHIETPDSFVPGKVLTLAGWHRTCPDFAPGMPPVFPDTPLGTPADVTVDGTYTIAAVFHSHYVVSFSDSDSSTDGGDWIVLDLGTDADVIHKWRQFALASDTLPTPGYDSFTLEVAPVTGGAEDPRIVTSATRIKIDAPELFGGRSAEGGIEGYADVMLGEADQVAPIGLRQMLGDTIPGFRGMFTLFFDGLVASMNPYPKAWKFRVRRAMKGWDGDVWQPDLCVIQMTGDNGPNSGFVRGFQSNTPPDDAEAGDLYITGDNPSDAWEGHANRVAEWSGSAWSFTVPTEGLAVYAEDKGRAYVYKGDAWTQTGTPEIRAMNPAHILYEVFTNRVWGRGLSRSMIDEDSWLAAAQTLYDEGFGLCLRWTRTDSIENFVQSVIDHIGAAVYTNRTTGKLALKLIRAVPDISALPLFDPSTGLLDVRDAGVASADYVNEVRVTYHDPVTNDDRTVKVDNLASLQASQGAFNHADRSYPGIPTAALATRVAQRDLRSVGIELRKFQVVLDRRAWAVTPGDAIRIRDPLRGIRETVLRVGRYEDGTIADGKITLTALQDMFALPTTSYVEQQQPVAPPELLPCVGDREVFELPYALLARQLNPADFNALSPDACYYGVVQDRGQMQNMTYSIATRNGMPQAEDAAVDGGLCGYRPLEFALAVDIPELFTGWSEDWRAVQETLLVKYNMLHGGGFVIDEPDYPTLDDAGLPLTTHLRGNVSSIFPIMRWKESSRNFSIRTDDFVTLEESVMANATFIMSLNKQSDGVTPRATQFLSYEVQFDVPFRTNSPADIYRAADVLLSILVWYGYPGDANPPGFYLNQSIGHYYYYKVGDGTLATVEGSPIFPFSRREKE